MSERNIPLCKKYTWWDTNIEKVFWETVKKNCLIYKLLQIRCTAK